MTISVRSKQHRRNSLAVGLVTVGVLSFGLAGAGAAAAAPVPAPAAGVAAAAVAIGVDAVTPPAVINLANVAHVVVTGTADSSVGQVTVAIDDQDPGTDAVMDTVTLPGGAAEQTWTSAPLDVSVLADGPLTVFSSFDGVTPAVDPSVDKDTVEPDFPTALPDAGTFSAATQVEISALDPADQSRTHYTTGTPTAADPTASDPVVPALLDVTRTEQVKAISFDAAGNPSPITTLDFIVVVTPPVVTPPVITPPVVTPPVVTPPVVTPPVVTPPVVTPPVVTPPVVTPPVVTLPAKPVVRRLTIVRVSPARDEYLSVRNTGAVSVNLRGWKLMNKAGHVLRLPNYQVNPGATVRIFTGSGKHVAGKLFLGTTSDVWGRHGTATLISNKGVRIASLHY